MASHVPGVQAPSHHTDGVFLQLRVVVAERPAGSPRPRRAGSVYPLVHRLPGRVAQLRYRQSDASLAFLENLQRTFPLLLRVTWHRGLWSG